VSDSSSHEGETGSGGTYGYEENDKGQDCEKDWHGGPCWNGVS
jgi:hypothetical protein